MLLAEEVEMVLSVHMRQNYGSRYAISGGAFPCYTKKQMHALHPQGNFKCATEYAPYSKRRIVGGLRYKNGLLPLNAHGSNSRFAYSVKGYAAIDEGDAYVALLRHVLWERIGLLLLIAALTVAGFLLAIRMNQKPPEQISAIPLLEKGAVDWQGVQMESGGGVAAGIAIPGYKSITVSANAAYVGVNLRNPEGNPCYFEIILRLEDGTELYRSNMIEPGKALYEIELAHALEPGEYKAALIYNTFSLADLTPLNGAEVQIDLIAK